MNINLFLNKSSSHSLYKWNLWGRGNFREREKMKKWEEQHIEKKKIDIHCNGEIRNPIMMLEKICIPLFLDEIIDPSEMLERLCISSFLYEIKCYPHKVRINKYCNHTFIVETLFSVSLFYFAIFSIICLLFRKCSFCIYIKGDN